jgi:hypothetical protein
MQRKSSALLFVTLGAALIAAPNLSHIGSESLYEQAFAAKGGNGKENGNNGNGGKAGGAQSAGKSGSAAAKTNFAAAGTTAKQKQLALSDPLAPAHPSMLGRWNAAKPIDHPSIQAHIRKGKFNGTMGMIAAYAHAQTTYNEMQDQLTAAQTLVNGTDLATLEAALSTALVGTLYTNVEAYNDAVELDATLMDPEVEAAKQAIADYEAAEAAIAAGELALDDLATAEANMTAYSNRAPWSDIRDDVRAKMGLEPTENDLAPVAPVTQTTQQ